MNDDQKRLLEIMSEMYGAEFSNNEDEFFEALSEGRIYFQPARANGKSFFTRVLAKWVAEKEEEEQSEIPCSIPFTLDYDTLMKGVSA